MPFVKPVNVYVNAVAGVGVYGVEGNHGPDELVLYCKLYDVMAAPPLSVGAAQLTVLIVFWFDIEEVIIGALGILDGVAVEFVV